MILRRDRYQSEPHCALHAPILEVSSSPQDRQLRRLVFRIPRLGLLVSQAVRARRYLNCLDRSCDTDFTISKMLQLARTWEQVGRTTLVVEIRLQATGRARDKRARHTILRVRRAIYRVEPGLFTLNHAQ